jgi:hypothetical protein
MVARPVKGLAITRREQEFTNEQGADPSVRHIPERGNFK